MPGSEPTPARSGAGVAWGMTRWRSRVVRDANVTHSRRDGCYEHKNPRTAPSAVAVVVAMVLAAGISGCTNRNGLALARQACSHVDRSLAIYHSAERSPGSAGAAGEQAPGSRSVAQRVANHG